MNSAYIILVCTSLICFSACNAMVNDYKNADYAGNNSDLNTDTYSDSSTNTQTEIGDTATHFSTESMDSETETNSDTDSNSVTTQSTGGETDSDTTTQTDIDTDTCDDTDVEQIPECLYYVNASSVASVKTGSNWQEAFLTIQEGIEAASTAVTNSTHQTCHVWVAKGIYHPTIEGKPQVAPVNPFNRSVFLHSHVAVYGGFKGDETLLGQRNVNTEVTTISGSIEGESAGVFHVVRGAGDSVLDGFSITGGNANGILASDAHGGGMFNQDIENIQVSNCVFTQNTASGGGGAVYNQNVNNMRIVNCRFHNNSVATGAAGNSQGGGIFNLESSLQISGCEFEDNNAGIGGAIAAEAAELYVYDTVFFENSSLEFGGAVYSFKGTNTRFISCTFAENSSFSGGATYLKLLEDLEMGAVFLNCVFYKNASKGGNGGALTLYGSIATVYSSTFVENSAGQNGGAMYFDESAATAVASIFWGNTVTDALYESRDVAFGVNDSTFDISYCDVQGANGCEEMNFASCSNNLSNVDPSFQNQALGDFRLTDISGCRGEGPLEIDNTSVWKFPIDRFDVNADNNTEEFFPFDRAGLPRIRGERIDIGAFETQ